MVHPQGAPLATSLTRGVTLLFALASGLAVANAYYAQPLLDTMAAQFGIDKAIIGLVMTCTQIGYGLGLLLLAPLGDMLDRKRLILGHFLLLTLALLSAAMATNGAILLVATGFVGMLAVVAQILVAYAASLASTEERGAVVGTVTSGIIIGILLARTVSGAMADLFGWRSVYFTSATATMAVMLALARVLPPSGARRPAMSYPRLITSTLTLLREEPLLRQRAILALLIFTAMTLLWTPIVLPLGAPPFSLSHTQIGLFGLAGAMGAVGASSAGRLADRGHAQKVTGVALLIMLVSWLAVALLPFSLWWLILGVITMDFGLQAVHVANQSQIYRLRPDARSRLAAAYMIFYSTGSATGSFLSTIIYARYGWSGVCTAGAVISIAALAFWARTITVDHQEHAKSNRL